MREHLIDLGKQSVITRDTVQLDCEGRLAGPSA